MLLTNSHAIREVILFPLLRAAAEGEDVAPAGGAPQADGPTDVSPGKKSK